MSSSKVKDLFIKGSVVLAGLAGLAVSPLAAAQSANREGNWEALFGVVFLNSSDVSFDGGTSADIDSDTGFKFGFGYHFTDNLEVGGSLNFSTVDYDAQIAGDEVGEFFGARGELETTTLMFDATYNLLDGPFSPFVSGGLGWNWTDTNLATEPPEIGCWWDPWWGYVCANFQDTRTIDGLAYELGVGARYDFGGAFVIQGAYRMMWIDFDKATSTPDFDAVEVNFGWKF